MITIKEYAKKNNVSYEAIRKQIKRYENELNGHVIKQNRTQFLDEVATAILDKHRKENPIVILNQDTDNQIQQLKEENRNLLLKVAAQADKITELSEWKADNAILIAEANQTKMLLEQNKSELGLAHEELIKIKSELDQEKNKGFFARLFKK